MAGPRSTVSDRRYFTLLWRYWAAWRRERALPVVAITGSNGKTSLKELISAGLSGRGAVHKTPGKSQESDRDPKDSSEWRGSEWAGVIEVGMSEPRRTSSLG